MRRDTDTYQSLEDAQERADCEADREGCKVIDCPRPDCGGESCCVVYPYCESGETRVVRKERIEGRYVYCFACEEQTWLPEMPHRPRPARALPEVVSVAAVEDTGLDLLQKGEAA